MGCCVYYGDVDGGILARDMEGWGCFWGGRCHACGRRSWTGSSEEGSQRIENATVEDNTNAQECRMET